MNTESGHGYCTDAEQDSFLKDRTRIRQDTAILNIYFYICILKFLYKTSIMWVILIYHCNEYKIIIQGALYRFVFGNNYQYQQLIPNFHNLVFYKL